MISNSAALDECRFLLQLILFDFSLTVKVAPHECVIRTGQPQT